MKIFILKQEDLYAGCDCGECSCWTPTVYETIGVFHDKEVMYAKMSEITDARRDAGYVSDPMFDVEEWEVS